jgi:thiosulfate reductase cytochrome b subunit
VRGARSVFEPLALVSPVCVERELSSVALVTLGQWHLSPASARVTAGVVTQRANQIDSEKDSEKVVAFARTIPYDDLVTENEMRVEAIVDEDPTAATSVLEGDAAFIPDAQSQVESDTEVARASQGSAADQTPSALATPSPLPTSTASEQVRIHLKHPLAIRWLHWINFPLLTILLWSGLLVYWANRKHEVKLGGKSFKFFPDGFFKALRVPFRLADGLQFHLTFSWLFTLNGVIYVVYLAARGGWRELLPKRLALRDAFYVVLHDLHLRKEAPPVPANSQKGYNAAQRIAYTAAVLMGLLAVLTGLAIAKSARFSFLVAAFGGYRTAKLIHFILALAFVGFFVVHILQVARAGWKNFRSMVNGRELIRETYVSVPTSIEVQS